MDPVAHKGRTDKHLDCIKLRIERRTSNEGFLKPKKKQDPGKWFTLTPFVSVYDVVSVVSAEGE